MAYPTVSSPYGLKPINLIGGQPYAGSTRAFKIASGYNQNIFYGDVVKIKRVENPTGLLGGQEVGSPVDGTIVVQKLYTAGIIDTTGPSPTFSSAPFPFALGVFMGCSYTDPVLKYKLFSQYYPAGLVADDIEAYVVDDPDALFKTAVITDYSIYNAGETGVIFGTTIDAVEPSAVGANGFWVYNGGDTNTGNSLSGVALDFIPVITSNPVTPAGLPFRVVDVVTQTATSSGFVEVIVKFNQPYLAGTGLGGGHEYQWPGYPQVYGG